MKHLLLKLIVIVLLWKLVTIGAAYMVAPLLPLQKDLTALRDKQFKTFGITLPYGAWVWGNMDGFYYMSIADRRDYHDGQEPFFPLFPISMIVIRQFFLTILPHFQGYYYLIPIGQFVSLASLIGALFIVYKLLRIDKSLSLFSFFLLLILTFPTSFYYGAVYNDALFFFLATLCIYLGRSKRWFGASVAGFFATLTRLNGLALFWYLVVEYLMVMKIKNWKIMSFFLLIPGAFLTYLGYIQKNSGSWHMLFDSMKTWGQDKPVFPLQVFWRYFKIIITANPLRYNYWVAIGELGFVLFLIGLLFYSYRKIRRSYWIFFFLSVLIPAMTGTFQGMPRYGLHLYPMYLSLALVLRQQLPIMKVLYIIISLILLIVYLTFFTRGYFAA